MICRYLARHVIDHTGINHGLAVVEVDTDSHTFKITPFAGETPATVLIDGIIEITATSIVRRNTSGKADILHILFPAVRSDNL